MNTILTVIKKELRDTLRDRRTLISAIILPAVLIPLILLGVTRLQKSLTEKEETKQLKVALIGAPPEVRQQFSDSLFQLQEGYTPETGAKAIAADSLDAMVAFAPDYAARIDSMGSGGVRLYYKSTNLLVNSRISEKMDALKEEILKERMVKLRLSPETLTPVVVTKVDVASPKEQIGKLVGGFLPYIFIIFCFMGCMYPAIDLITGEKEKGTIETLLTAPASRFGILIGKMATIALVGMAAALMTILGMAAAVKFMPDIPPDFLTAITDILSLKFILMLFAMLLPLSVFFAGLLSALVIRAKSFKEAQSMATPMTFVVIVPAMVALMPGVELSWQTAFVPILNVALATKEIIAGTIALPMYAAIVVSLVLLALAAAWLSYRQFSKEGMVLK